MSGRRLSLGLISLDFEDLATLYGTAADRGLDQVEVFIDVSATEADADRLLAERETRGIRVSSVSSMAKLAQGGDADARLVERSIRLAAAVGAPFATFMYGSPAGLDRRAARERFLARVAPLAEQAEQAGVTLLIENVFSRGTDGDLDSVEAILDLFDRVDGDRVGLNYDPANLAIAGRPAGAEAFRALRELIRSVHLKDVRPRTEGPLGGRRVLTDHARGPFVAVPLGEGIVPVGEILAELDGRDLPVALEPTAQGPERDAWLDASLAFLGHAAPVGGVR